MDTRTLYHGSLAAFGLVSVIDTLLAVPDATLIDWITGAAGLFILALAVRGFRNPEDSGAPTERGPVLYVVVAAATLYVVGAVVRWL